MQADASCFGHEELPVLPGKNHAGKQRIRKVTHVHSVREFSCDEHDDLLNDMVSDLNASRRHGSHIWRQRKLESLVNMCVLRPLERAIGMLDGSVHCVVALALRTE